MTWTFGVGVAMALASAAAFFYVGHRLGRREVRGAHATAWTAFRVWWFAIGAEFLVSGTISLLAGLGLIGHHVYATFIYLNLGFLALGIFGLVYFLLFVFTGRRRLFVPLAAVYLFYYLDLLYIVTFNEPAGLRVGEWRANLVFERTTSGPVASGVSRVLGWGVPGLCGILFATLAFRTGDRTQRWRTLLVAAAVVAWALNQVLAGFLRLAPPDWYQFANRSIGVLAALLVFLAYFPPAALRARLGVESVETEGRRGPAAAGRPEA